MDAVYYGSPGLSTSSYLLSGYPGLPFVLSCFRLRFSIAIRKILMLGQMSDVPKGYNFAILCLLIFNSSC